ncbi:hypothetical protein FZI85_12280 [Mycobacterium sp. CBMA293]|nr:hypothetical protein [Mycolicibacterium sp. CBMA 360]MUL59312.1 hypothetical protein [Mycolicibacterium sp. CBMA 335]MUL71037.1 hypothetical protein [Mycolicibacterium sp. CBMA 311]MUL94680.1 hypothetical protein [Mycolicibacterium sp. CBMA 230]MUM09142.1 hypothetical protein [Mycolicibacterium sp. CBMA 213]MUM11800.1 hypothetical protein [Mycolicibacterium sp. CBMA 293]MUM30424.1 hypothetical protein [Mycolicibacterium sp. CBMA 361]
MHVSKTPAKLQVGIAACAVAAAATLTPVMAHADLSAPAPLAPITRVLDNIAQAPLISVPQDLNTWWQNDPWWWLGQGSNPNPGAPILVGTFTPLSIIPGFLQDTWMRLTQNLNFSVCFLGAGAKIGPYGTITVSLTRGC